MRALEGLLAVVEPLRDDERWLRTFYGNIWQVGEILFAQGQTAKGAKRLLRELKNKWQRRLRRLDTKPDDPGRAVLDQWLEQTDSYWPGLFPCYSSPCIPATNNDTEQFILLVKNLERRLANNPQPAVRFVRHAPVSALFIGRDELPGADFIARCAVDGLPAAKALLALRRKKTGAMRRARKDFAGETDRLLERWKKATTGPPDVPIMAPSRSQAA